MSTVTTTVAILIIIISNRTTMDSTIEDGNDLVRLSLSDQLHSFELYFVLLGQKPDGSGSAASTLEIRKIPAEFNTISKLNEHFSKFGTVTNVQVLFLLSLFLLSSRFSLKIAYDGASDSALVAYATFQEAETAYKNPEPLFNNRFIKIFWHNSNKVRLDSLFLSS